MKKYLSLQASAGAKLLAAAENLGGETALHLAAKNGSENVLCFLLAAGCWPGTKDADGRTPLASACAGGRTGTAAVLLTGQGWGLEHLPEGGWVSEVKGGAFIGVGCRSFRGGVPYGFRSIRMCVHFSTTRRHW